MLLPSFQLEGVSQRGHYTCIAYLHTNSGFSDTALYSLQTSCQFTLFPLTLTTTAQLLIQSTVTAHLQGCQALCQLCRDGAGTSPVHSQLLMFPFALQSFTMLCLLLGVCFTLALVTSLLSKRLRWPICLPQIPLLGSQHTMASHTWPFSTSMLFLCFVFIYVFCVVCMYVFSLCVCMCVCVCTYIYMGGYG